MEVPASAPAVIGRNIRRLYRLSQRYYTAHMDHPDLTPSELQLLRHIGFHGEVSQRHLAETLGVDKAMISRTLQRLEEKGYILRKKDEKDARSKKAVALPPAKEIHLQGRELSESFFGKLTDGFSEEELEIFTRLLTQMAEKGKILCRREGDAT